MLPEIIDNLRHGWEKIKSKCCQNLIVVAVIPAMTIMYAHHVRSFALCGPCGQGVRIVPTPLSQGCTVKAWQNETILFAVGCSP